MKKTYPSYHILPIAFLLTIFSIDHAIGQDFKSAPAAAVSLTGNANMTANAWDGIYNDNHKEALPQDQIDKIKAQGGKHTSSFLHANTINFTTFTPSRLSNSKEVIEQNKGHENDPELGVLFSNAPCKDCYEILEKRTETQKYFVQEGSDAKKFVLQSSQYPMHYRDNKGAWRTITDHLIQDNAHTGVYSTTGRPVDIKVNTEDGYVSLSSSGGSIIYNHGLELVYIKPDGTEQSLGKANWSNHTAGDNGVRVKNAWPGIDMEMAVLVNSLKTNFVLNSALPVYAAGKLVLRDHLKLDKGLAMNAPSNTAYTGAIQVRANEGATIYTIQQAIAYEQNGNEESVQALNYNIAKGNTLEIEVPGSLLNKPASSYPLVIDPLVSGTFSSGFTYSTAPWPPSIPSAGYCANTNNVTIPAAATLSDIQVTFTYYGPAAVAWSQSVLAFQINGGCTYGWLSCGAAAFSSGIPGNTCGLTNSSMWSAGAFWGTTAGCVPGYSCTSYNLPFQLLSAQRQTSTAACAQTVYATASGFTVNVFGSVATLPTITPSGPSTVCMPSTLTLTGSPAGGVWSSTSPGVATVPGGVVTGVSNGTTTINYVSSGCTTSVPITVGTTPTVTGGTSICFPGSTTLTGTPAGGVWTSSAPAVATVVGGFVNGVSVGTTVINYNTGTCSRSVPVDVNAPGAVTPTTQPTGITFSGTTPSGTTINFTPNGSTGYLVIASTSASLSATPTLYTTYATGSSFGGGIVIQGSASGSAPSYTTTLLASNTQYNIFVFAFNNNCVGPQYNITSPLTGVFNTCIAGTGVPAVVSSGMNSINLSWPASPAGGGYITPINYTVYAYSDAAMTILVPGYPAAAGIGTTYTATGLASTTQYWFRISPSDACAIMSPLASGMTTCATTASIPYLQTFEVSTTIGDHNPNCMTSNVQNCVFSAVQTSVTYLGTINTNHTPAGSKFYNFFPGGACSAGWQNQWLLTPGMAMTAGTTYKLSFWYRTDGNTWTSLQVQYSDVGLVPSVLSSSMGGTPGSIGSGITGFNNTGYTQYIQTFTVPATGTYYVGFDAAATGITSLLAIDDIEICAVPNVVATNSAPPYCAPANVFLGSTGTTGAFTYAWSGPSGYTSTLAYPPLTGVGAGTYTYSVTAVNDPISLGYGGYCSSTASTTFTVNTPPGAITGTPSVCTGLTTALANPVSGGVWSSSVPAVGSVSATGVVTGITAGTTVISYTVGGCFATVVVSVTTMPGSITGIMIACLGACTNLSNAVPGGTWSSSNTAVGTVNATTGVACGVSLGTTVISYSFGGSCYVTTVISVNPYPNPITGSPSVCIGSTTTLSSTTPSGVWSSSASGIAGVNPISGVVTGNALGTAVISYRVAGCSVTQIETVVPTPPGIVGPATICLGFPTSTYTNTAIGGTWTSSNANVSIGSSTGIATGITAGPSVITYSLSAGCFSSLPVTVLPAPAPISGTLSVCQGNTTLLSHGTAGGTWSSGSTPVATVGLGTGLVTAVVTGNTSQATATITYTLPSGCIATSVVSVNPLPNAITGTTVVCQGGTTTLSASPSGGTWSSGATAIGTIGSSTGVFYGSSAGTASVTYTLATGCITSTVVSVNPLPGPITGSLSACVGGTTTLASTPSGGAWISGTTANASISGTGVVTGNAIGTSIITYVLSTGCQTTAVVSVNPGPAAILGSLGICVGYTTNLSSSTPGGVWSSSASGIAPVTSSGVVSGSLAGTATISYTVAGCSSTVVVTVSAVPAAITGTLSTCVNSTTTLSNATAGGTWSTSTSVYGTIDAVSGVLTGLSGFGTTTITYTLGSGCIVTAVASVYPLPAAITGNRNICEGATSTLSSTSGGGTWSSSATATASVGIGTGIVTGGSVTGTATITYRLSPSGCITTAEVTVSPLPATITGGTTICVGSTTTLSTTPSGGAWSSLNTAVGTVGAATGIVYGVSPGTATIVYTAPVSGCTRSIVVLINPLPTGISGTLTVCEGATTALIGSPAGGTWLSSNLPTATVGLGSGIVTGGSTPGNSTITYTLPTTCYITAVATVYPLPVAITGTATMCVGSTTTLSNTSAGGTWSSNNAGVASVGSLSGIVTGVSAGGGSATTTITYTLPTGCRRTTTVTVYALPGTISGPLVVCEGSNATLSSTPAGGTWASSNAAVGTIGLSTGVFTGVSGPGTSTVTYTLGTGCFSTVTVSVSPLPAAITGGLTTCVGATTLLSSTTSGGTWTSGNTPVATVNSSSGLVTGVSGGSGSATANITYTLPTGCRTVATVTVYALPANITGANTVCENATITLSNASTGGTWSSSNTAVGTVDPVSGVVTGIAGPGTTVITYTLGSGCIKTAVVSVSALPASISGVLAVCIGLNTTLSSSPAGGTWSSSNTVVASVGVTSGVVTGNASGTSTVSYTVTGCSRTAVVSVNGLPGSITGTRSVCEGSSTTLSSLPAGGTWSSASANVSVVAATGVINGIAAGNAEVTYTLGTGCITTAIVTVNPLPAPIGGSLNLCQGFTTALTEATPSGVWSSTNTTIATITSAGVVTGNVAGTSTISYYLPATGCVRTADVTVNALPAPIAGSSGFCNLTSTTMTSPTPGVITWGSLDPGIVSIDPVTGVATGVSVGTGTITVATSAGCTASKTITIILAPFPITGPSDVCIGSTITLGNIISGGTWTSTNTAAAPIGFLSGIVTGNAAGTTSITYVLSTGCFSERVVTVNPIPDNVAGALSVCEGLTTTLSNPVAGGTWSSSDPAVGTIDAISGLATGIAAGTTNITYALSTGCNATVVLTVNPLPAAITGVFSICTGSSQLLSDATSGGVWSSSAPGIAYIAAGTGVATGVNDGTAMITYTLGTGCIATQEVTVYPLPDPIVGAHGVCQNDSVTLTDATPGGVWVSSDPTIASVSSIGVVTGNTPGVVAISYMLPTSCAAVIIFTVNGIPANISGSLSVCAGFATNLTDATPDGTWSADPAGAGIATIHHITGVVTGITPGTVNITYTLGTGCKTYAVVTVIVLPAVISGTPQVCVGGTTALSNPAPGGTWSSSNSNATVDAVTGVVTGISAGPAVITYTVGTGCFNVLHITVNPLPAAITGPSQVCEGSSITLVDATTGGIWISGNTGVATVGFISGVVTGVHGPNAVLITYTLPTGCIATKEIMVNATPPAIAGSGYICTGSAVNLSNGMPGGVWSSSNTAVATVSPLGVVNPVSLGTSVISYIMPGTGCYATKVVTVAPLPVVYTVFGGGSYCSGGNGVHVKLSGSQIGVSYVLYYGSSATGYLAGTGDTLDFGLLTLPGAYSVQATYAASGCARDMNGSVNVVITPLIAPTVGIIAVGGDSTCPGSSVTLNPDPTNGGTSPAYLWKVNGVSVSTASSYTFVPADGDVVTVTMVSNGSCLLGNTATGTKTLRVLPNAVPMVSVSADPGDTICQYSLATFTANADYGGNSPVYTWMVNGTTVGAGSSYAFVPEQGDVVAVQMVSNYLCRLATTVTSSNLVMTVDSMIVPHVSIIPDPALSVAEGESVTLRTIVTNAGSNPVYQWKINGYPVPGATSDTFRSVFHDYDSINCVVTSSGVCHNISTFDWVFVSVSPLNVQTANGSGSDLRLLPNPNKGLFTIRGTLGTAVDETVSMEVTDMLGQVVYRGSINAIKGRINDQVQLANTLANGMYILSLHTASETKIFHFVMEQ